MKIHVDICMINSSLIQMQTIKRDFLGITLLWPKNSTIYMYEGRLTFLRPEVVRDDTLYRDESGRENHFEEKSKESFFIGIKPLYSRCESEFHL